MRKFAYAIFQMALDVLVTLLFLRPYVETASFFSGKLAAFGTIILMIVPTITATLLFVVDNLGKEETHVIDFCHSCNFGMFGLLYKTDRAYFNINYCGHGCNRMWSCKNLYKIEHGRERHT